jgi:HYR domain/Right handed beta helix region
MSHEFWTRLRGCVAALAVVGASLLAVAPSAGAETFKAETTEQFEEDVAKANANGTANTIVVQGGVFILPLKTMSFTNKSGVQTIEGPTAIPGAKLEGSAVEPFPSELFLINEGVSVTFKDVLVSHSGGEGAPAIEELTGGKLTLENSTVAGNKAIGVIVEPGSTATVDNSTISDQAAGGMVDNGTASFFNSTVAFNEGIGVENKGTLNLTNTIVAENKGEQCVGKATKQDHSLDSDGSCGVEKSGVNPLLTELFIDGGSTPLHSLKPGSPAIKAGDETTCLKTDQEGNPRPGIPGGPCDIGADEYNETPPTIKVPANITTPATSSAGAVVTYTAEATSSVAAIRSFKCTPASGSTFAIGTTTVECTAVDGHENKATAKFTVTVHGAKWKINGKELGTTHEPVLSYGEIELKNASLHNLKCQDFAAGEIWNEGGLGLEKTIGYTTYSCQAEQPCKVKNTRGEEVEGVFATAEAPQETAKSRTGISSLPWTGEVFEKEAGVDSVLTHHVKIWIVLPPVGTGAGCIGAEVPFEDQEGATEKEAGDELAPATSNGAKNGVHPSRSSFDGEEGLVESEKKVTKPARTGRLVSPSAGLGYAKGTLWFSGAKKSGAAFELVTSE